MIREVYTGKYPKDGGKDMLVTSAIKGFSVADAKPRALNFLKNKVTSKTRLERRLLRARARRSFTIRRRCSKGRSPST